MGEQIAVFSIDIKERDGRFYAFSNDLPGLNVCGDSLKDVKEDLVPMIERMYQLNLHRRVKAAPAVDAVSFKEPNKSTANGNFRFWATPLEQLAA